MIKDGQFHVFLLAYEYDFWSVRTLLLELNHLLFLFLFRMYLRRQFLTNFQKIILSILCRFLFLYFDSTQLCVGITRVVVGGSRSPGKGYEIVSEVNIVVVRVNSSYSMKICLRHR